MSVWYCVPSARPVAEADACLGKWTDRGYRTAVWIDEGKPRPTYAAVVLTGEYQGYAKAMNELARTVLCNDPSCNVVVTGGDDIFPDERHDPAVLEQQFIEHFGGTFGVMQPTGDRWMEDAEGRSSEERVCSSPWMGREFCERMYGGQGPLWPGWWHFYEDEELHEVASSLGVLWHRPDVRQYHAHWMRTPERKRPGHLDEARLDWAKAKRLFEQRKAAAFPDHEPLPKEVVCPL